MPGFATRVWWMASLAALAACDGPGVYEGVVYDARFGDAASMDVHVPDNGDAGRPAVMLIHGGGWRHGDKEHYTDAAERLAGAGFVAATINYRLVPGGIYPAMVQDCLCALAYLRANADAYGLDPERIAVAGYSAGAHLAALVGLAADVEEHAPDCEWGPTGAPAAVIPGDGIYDFREGDTSELIEDFLGGSRDEVPETYEAASPMAHVRGGMPPFLVIHGADDVVPVANATGLVDDLRAAGNQAWLLELDGAGHVTTPGTGGAGLYGEMATEMPEAWLATIDFLDQTLGAP